MACTEFGINIPNDENGKLLADVNYVAGTDSIQAKLLAGYITSDDFFNFCLNDPIVIKRKTKEYKNVQDVNTNSRRRLLREYYEAKHHNVENSAAIRNATSLDGFGSHKARAIALDHTSNLIIKTYYPEIFKPKAERLSRGEILRNIIKEINRDFTKIVAIPFMKELKATDNKKAIAKVEDASKTNKEYNAVVRELNYIAEEIPRLDPVEDADKIKELNEKYNELEEQLAQKESERYIKFRNIIEEYGNERQKNYLALVKQVRGNANAWFVNAFKGTKLNSLVREFEQILESDKLNDVNFVDENDYYNDGAESIDEMSKSWEDKLYKSFDKHVSVDVKLYFNTLYKLAAPTELGKDEYSYDTNNELGVPMTMGANYIITQLSNFARTNSVPEFIRSINEAASTIPSLYGLGKLVNDMIKNPVFANNVFTQISNPKIAKTIITLTENGIDFSQNNSVVEPTACLIYNMMNNIKSTYRNNYNENDIPRINEYIMRLSKENVRLSTKEDYDKYISAIEDYLFRYFPSVDKNGIRQYIYKGEENPIVAIDAMFKNIRDLIRHTENVIGLYNKAYREYREKYDQYIKNDRIGEEPIFDSTVVDFEELYSPIISIAKALTRYTAVKNELNSVNAEGNTSSSLINNSYITNIIKQINYSSEESINAGLERLRDEISKTHQYDYSPIFFGVQDSTGETLVDGLFIKDAKGNITINPNAKNLLNASLFDGAKDSSNSNAVMYDTMSKGDYFLSQIIAYKNPLGFGDLIVEKKDPLRRNYGGYFMRTPSDAPKNFIIQGPKYSKGGELFKVVTSTQAAYMDKVRNEIKKRYGLNERLSEEAIDFAENVYTSTNKKLNNNEYSAEDIYSMFIDGVEDIKYNDKYFEYDEKTNKVRIPVVYIEKIDTGKFDKKGKPIYEEVKTIVILKGDKVVGEMGNIANNVEIEGIYNPYNEMPEQFFLDIADIIKNEGIASGEIQRVVNENNPAFRAFRTHLLNEFNTYIAQLKNVFERNSKYEIVTKTDTTGLIERVHFNGDIVVDGKLSGNFFKFNKLFEINGYDVNERINELLSLYGQANSLFIKKGKGLKINTKRRDILTKDANGELVLSVTDELNKALDTITTEWLDAYSKEITAATSQYSKILSEQDILREDVQAALIDGAIMAMNFDDLFEGDSKFYKDAQTFLKRAKEVQAGGKAYAGFDLNDNLSLPIHNVLDINGAEQLIGYDYNSKVQYYVPRKGEPMVARNGFRAVTIVNTVRPSENAGRIKQELLDTLDRSLSEEQRESIATEIAKGYFDLTTTNDAQSYITLDEFVRRRFADGTLDQYKDILSQIMEVRNGTKRMSDIDLKGINARIQVQKNFYYDMKYDEVTHTRYPRQIKNAEFVLIPELIKGTQLEQLHDLMEKYDIGQVNTAETSKAAKKNVIEFWDNDGNVNPNFEADLITNNQAPIEDYYYRFLYKQQDVSEHMKDEHNKAGIQIMKKILDNASKEVEGDIKNFFKNYCANIKSDFRRLITNMGWKETSDGKLVNAKDGSNVLNFDEFYKKARLEAQRLGLDSNFAEYLTPDEFGNPSMPNYMNNVSSKLESIAQAIFNNAITRQTLPGWHAAQVTSVGHGVLDSNGKFRKLKYHPEVRDKDGNVKQEAYAEVLIPRWSSLIPKNFNDFDKLEKEGLDIHIGYRIPTEGKQSVSVFKVVGFLDDLYGSTIMVPDEWVTQTGSDFDVDTVYGISYHMYKDRNGVLKKYELDTDPKNARNRYNRYIKNAVKEKINKELVSDQFLKDEMKQLYNSLSNPEELLELSTKFKDLFVDSRDIFNKLPKDFKKQIYLINDIYGAKNDILERYDAVAKKANEYAEQETDEELKKLYKEFAEKSISIADTIALMQNNASEFLKEFREAKRNKYVEIFEDAAERYNERIDDAAKKANLVTFEEFEEWDILDQNSREARDNMILTSMINIMNNPNSREENYSRSNFDDIVRVIEHTNKLRGVDKKARSPYNPLDQIDFFENAMSGAQLKAMSVVRDTFNSVNNYVKSNLSEENVIPIEYDLNDYDAELLKNTFDRVEIDEERGIAIVYHNRIGNSKNNRNVVGKLITPYSSQTTAHILDAIKSGAIFNENKFTFGTFKTLVDVGTDYETAIAFLTQPAITRIVEADNETRSIFVNARSNPIDTTIKRIARDLGVTISGEVVNEFSQIDKVINLLSVNKDVQNALRRLFGADVSVANKLDSLVFNLNRKMLENRLQGVEISKNSTLSQEEKQVEDLVFDLAMVMTFRKIYRTTRNIENIARCSNPDRFGAKQTVRATRMILDNINLYSLDKNNPVGNTIMVGDKNLLQALYPVGEDGIDVDNSAYPYLAAFLKYSTIPSVQINKQLFPTENDYYTRITNTVQNKLGIVFTDEQYKEYKQYMMSHVYYNVPFLNSPLIINKDGYIDFNTRLMEEQAKDATFYWDNERSRILGYDVTESSNIVIDNINKPTEDEIYTFSKLTPAQKALWIQTNFDEGKGVFDFLNVNMFNQKELKTKGFTSQTIRFNDQVDNVEEIYKSFRETFFNKNPLIRLAAIDLIKYSFIAEGFKFKKGSLSKIITNDSLYSSLEDMGLNLIHSIKEQFNKYTNPVDAATQDFIEKFVRSHSEIVREVKIPRIRKNADNRIAIKFNHYQNGKSLIYIPFEDYAKDLLNHINVPDINSPKEYVRITKNANKKKVTTLYKIVKENRGIYLVPLNLLERNETTDYSANKNNNKFYAREYYDEIIKRSAENGITINELLSGKKEYQEIQVPFNQFTIKRHVAKKIHEGLENPNELIKLSNVASEIQSAEIQKFFKDVRDRITDLSTGELKYGVIFNDNRLIANTIPPKTSIIQNIPVDDGYITVKISRYIRSNGKSKEMDLKIWYPGARGTITKKEKAEEKKALKEVNAAASINPTLYKIEPVIDKEVRESVEETDKKRDDEAAEEMMAITSILEDVDTSLENTIQFDAKDKVAKQLYNEMSKRSHEQGNIEAIGAIRSLNVKGIDAYSSQSIHDNSSTIYRTAAEYYVNAANKLIDNIERFQTIDGETYNIGDPKLYEYLREHPEDYPVLVKLILDAKTFGNQFADIMSLDLKGEDAITDKAIARIRKAINDVKNNTKLKKAVELLFNDYIANEYSTNPIIRKGLNTLRTQFGDVDWFDLNFSDIGELNHKQIQTVAKYVYSILNEATRVIAPKAVSKFTEQFDSIMNETGEFDWNHIITDKGKFITPYNDKFLEDREKYANAVRDAKDTYGVDSIQYVKAKLERDKWRAKNVHQEIISTYYEEDTDIREAVIRDAPKEYIEYMRLIHQLYDEAIPGNRFNKDEIKRRKAINAKLSRLLSHVNESGEEKSLPEIARIGALKRYIKRKKDLNSRYFVYKETDGFKSTLEHYIKVIKRYEKANPNTTLDERLADDNYREAYDWIQVNTNYTIDPDSKLKIYEAFNTLRNNADSDSSKVKTIIEEADAYDEYGNVDPRKFSAEQLARIKKLNQYKFSYDEQTGWNYDSTAGEAILIKNIPKGIPVYKDSFYRLLRDESENAEGVNPLRLKIIGEINDMLSRAIDDTGYVSAAKLFEYYTEDELEHLGSLYRQLRKIKGKRKSKELAKRFKDNVNFRTYDAAFNEAFLYAKRKLTGRKYDLWIDIFVQTNADGAIVTKKDGSFVPNNDLFGYIVAKDTKYIDKEKTEARKLIENDIEFIPTEYYYAAAREATANGTFKEWYEANHVFNPYTHKVEPLRVWTSMQVNPNGNLKGSYSYNPTYENTERTVRSGEPIATDDFGNPLKGPDYRNPNYKEYSMNYNVDTGDYNNLKRLSPKERKMMDLLQSTINYYASTYGMKKFAEQGYLPRRARITPDARWYVGQAIGSIGLEFRNTGEAKWTEKVDYTHDHDADFDMMSLLKKKGYVDIQRELPYPQRGTSETEDDYNKRLEDWRKEVKEAEEHNLKLDNEILDRDWKSVFQDFITKATEYNARQRVKNTAYLLLEDLKDNEAYAVSRRTGNLKVDKKNSTKENTEYQTVQQTNAYAIAQNWIRRILFKEFKKDSSYSKWADMMQNITSAKYMIFNVTGGIANIGTGWANIMNESFAKEYFDNKTLSAATTMYMSNSIAMIRDMYSETTTNDAVALTKLFDIVDFDSITERRPNESATETIKRVRDSLYSMQSGGEHFMQNVALFAMLKSHRIFTDTDGTVRCGSFADYTWKLESETLAGLLNGKEDLMTAYKSFLNRIHKDLNQLKRYDNFTKDFNEEFLREVGDKQLIKQYIAAKKEALKNAKRDFNDDTKHPTAESQFTMLNGKAVIKDGSAMTGQMFGELVQKVIQVNKKIHGVYDKIGAAKIEAEWWGGLVMQYHKHIYPGMMKRYRVKGYYNEIRSTIERGSYISLASFLGTEFKGIGNRIKENNSNIALASIQEVIKSAVDTVTNISMNWGLMPEWEKSNIKRCLGDLYGISAAILLALAIYGMTDDDDIKESEVLAIALYMSDRLLAEAQMYTPWGLPTEAKTLWSSPLAVQNGPKDLLKGLSITTQWLLDEDYNVEYTTGLYKGQNKLAVLLYRNTPIWRVYQRLSNMTKNNNYYRINEKSINLKFAKTIADNINPD